MKRKLALLLLVLLVAAAVFAACSQPEDTTEDVRWGTEKHVFRVSLADFVGSNDTGIFKAYDASGAVVKSSDTTYRKDRALSNESFTKDEIVPIAVDGTYTLTITPQGDPLSPCKVTGEQVLYVQYSLESTVQGETVDLTQWEELDNLKVDDGEVRENTNLEINADSVVLKSTTTTVVEFKNQTQQPTSSSTTVDGFYIGKANRQVSKYDVSTEYDFSKENKKPKATVKVVDKVNNTTKENTYELANSNVKLIDSNQLLIYVRSLSKTEGSLQDGHTANVFDPLTGKTQTANFAYSYADRMILTDNVTNQKLFTTVNAVAVSIGGNAFMMQENVPQTIEADKVVVGGERRSGLTTLHFRVGYLSYEIEYSNNANTVDWSTIWSALTIEA